MLRPLFFALLPFALLGDLRVFLFVMNRYVIGINSEEKTPWRWLMVVLPPLLLFLTGLLWPLHQWLRWLSERDVIERLTPQPIENLIWSLALAKLGAVWLFVAAAIGLYWIVDRFNTLLRGAVPVWGVRTFEPELVRMRKEHIPFRTLRKLGAHNEVYDLEITRHEIFIDDLPEAFEGYRIAFLTDTHVTSYGRKFLRECIARTRGFDPDLVLLGGDFVSFHRHIDLMAETLLTDLTARDGIFAVLGNHDIWAGGDDVLAAMKARGVEFVINRSVTIRRGEEKLQLTGIDEIYRGKPDVEAAFARVDPTHPTIGLSHHPDVIDRLDGRRLDLLLCGHTHGGQIRFPFFGAIVVPSLHEARYAQGFHRLGRVLMYVSRGVGAIPPVRILCRPEVATFVLRRTIR